MAILGGGDHGSLLDPEGVYDGLDAAKTGHGSSCWMTRAFNTGGVSGG